mgnify:CR=1 FL=1
MSGGKRLAVGFNMLAFWGSLLILDNNRNHLNHLNYEH